jgi:hypothetical protein
MHSAAGPANLGGGSGSGATRPVTDSPEPPADVQRAVRRMRTRMAHVRQRAGGLHPDERQALIELLSAMARLLDEPPPD